MNQYASLREHPEWVSLETARGWEPMERTGELYELRDTSAAIREDGTVLLTAWEPIFRLRIAWRQEILEPVKILGDHWERGVRRSGMAGDPAGTGIAVVCLGDR